MKTLCFFILLLVGTACTADPGAAVGTGLATAVWNAPPTASTHVLVIATDYVSGDVSSLDTVSLILSPMEMFTQPGAPAHVSGDTIARVIGETAVLLDRSPGEGDDATYFDLRETPPTLLGQRGLLAPTEGGSSAGARPTANAHDFLVVDNRHAYVSRWDMDSLGVIALATGEVTGTVDLRPYTDGAPLPEPDALARVGTEVWLTLERLGVDPLVPSHTGVIVRIDPARDAVTGTVTLPFANPTGSMQPAPDGDGVVLAAVGDYHVVGDGGVLQVHVNGTVTVAVRETDVGGNIDAVSVLDSHRLLLRVPGAETSGTSGAVSSTALVAWDLTTRTPTVWRTWSLWNPAAPLVLGDRVYVGDPGDLRHGGAGVRVYGLDGREVTTAPVPVRSGFIPYDIEPAP